jgi:hypothetical protein
VQPGEWKLLGTSFRELRFRGQISSLDSLPTRRPLSRVDEIAKASPKGNMTEGIGENQHCGFCAGSETCSPVALQIWIDAKAGVFA